MITRQTMGLLKQMLYIKQKTAYEITYGDWSSDVCSSDLLVHRGSRDVAVGVELGEARPGAGAGSVHPVAALFEADQIGLEALEPLLTDLATKRDDVVERPHRLDPGPFLDPVCVARAIGAAMRPVGR